MILYKCESLPCLTQFQDYSEMAVGGSITLGSFESLFDFYCHNLVQEEARVALFGGICAGKYLHLSQSFAECMHPQPFNYSGPDSKLDMVRNVTYFAVYWRFVFSKLCQIILMLSTSFFF